MSAGSFDDSSTLVDVASPTNGEHKDGANVEPDDKTPDLLEELDDTSDIKEHDSKSKSKKSKAKKLFKRAKSPISGAINKTTKEFKKLSQLPKHHYSSSPKSPQRSPSRENLTEEYSHLEQRLGEKKSEEWLAFQQMQERIKQTVLKTQNSLHKYTSQDEEEDVKQEKANWTGFDDDSALDPEELVDISSNPSINISCINNEDNEVTNQGFKDIPKGRFHLHTTPAPSPPISPGPPVNSRISSMENLLQDQDKENKPQGHKQEEVDLLGLLDTNSITAPTISDNKASNLLSQDLLDLDNFMTPVPVNVSSGDDCSKATDSQVLSGYSFSMSMTNDSTLNNELKTDMNDVLMFEQPVSESQPLSTKDEPPSSSNGLFGTNNEKVEAAAIQPVVEPVVQIENKFNPTINMMGDTLEPVLLEPVYNDPGVKSPALDVDIQLEPSNTSALDDLAGFDPMKSDTSTNAFNSFTTTSACMNIMHDNQSTIAAAPIYGSSPQGMTFGSVPMGVSNIETDLLSKIKRMSGSQPVSPARRMAPKPPVDHFGFVKKELKKNDDGSVVEDDGEYKGLADLIKGQNKDEEESIPKDTEKDTDRLDDPNIANVANNPFLSGDLCDDSIFPTEGLNGSAAAVFGLEPEHIKHESTLTDLDNAWGENISESKGQQWTDVNALDDSNFFGESVAFDKTDSVAGIDLDTAWDAATSSNSKVMGDAWGSGQQCTAEGSADESSNPFQDDFSKLDNIPFESQGEANVNPFLSVDLTNNPSNATSRTNNPFLDFGIQPSVGDQVINKPAVLSDSENFFMDSVADSHDLAVSDDIFDPFKVTSTKSETSGTTSDQNGMSDTLDIFSNVAASGDKQLAKPSADDDDHGFLLEIKPVHELSGADASTTPAPAIKPPPRPPKSPLPPRENPFDRESPPEENFAQFEVMDSAEKPKEAPPKSISTDSYTTEEEEVNLEPLQPFLPVCEKEGFKLMLRYPTKKKIAGNRYWKNVYVKLQKQSDGPVIKVFSDAKDALPMQELPLQACYSLSDVALQQYDQYGKIHTVKLQYVFYKERVGIKTERITPSIVKFKKREKPKATMILDHSPQVSELLKFGSLDKNEVIEFIREVEDAFMHLEAHREKTLTYTKDEVTAEVRDEYIAELDKHGKVISQKARVRVFVLAFLTGMPTVEIGLNDKRRRGKEVVGRCDIIPIKTEEWIKLEDVEFHCSVDKDEFEKTNNIKFHPLDACQFELLRYRVRLRENKELPLQLTVQQIFKNRKCEIRCDLLVTGYHSYSKKHGQFPCEDIEVRFPIPETWIYMFRYERRFGYGSYHSTTRKPGKIKGLERLTMMAQGNLTQALMEADVGTAKYEHVYRSVVWRIPRLPVRNQGAYTSHLLKLKLELAPHDEIPESYEQYANVEFTMPCSTTSQSQIRSIAVTNPNPPEKWVRSMARYEYLIEIEHLNEYPEFMAIGAVYKEVTKSVSKSEDEITEPEERDPRLAVSDSDSSDSE